MKKLLLLLALAAGPALSMAQNGWTQLANFPLHRAAAAGFSLGPTGYVCAGAAYSSSSATILYHDLWAYNPATNTWSQQADLPGPARTFPVAFVVGTKAYVGTGGGAQGAEYDDWWTYDPATNTWTRRAPVPGGGRNMGFGFALNGKGYVGGGTAAARTAFWEYDPAADSWTARAPYAGGDNYGSASFAAGGRGYVAGGANGTVGGYEQLWAYDPLANQWARRANLPPGLDGHRPGFELGGQGIVYAKGFTPGGGFVPYLVRYQPATDTWQSVALPVGGNRDAPTGFALNGRAYIGTGLLGFNSLADFWEYNPATPMPVAPGAGAAFACWPTPTTGLLHLRGTHPAAAYLYNATGQLVRTLSLTAGTTTADLSGLPAGAYVLRSGQQTRRVVVRH